MQNNKKATVDRGKVLQRTIIILLLLIIIVLLLLLLNKKCNIIENVGLFGPTNPPAVSDEGPMDGSGYLNNADEFNAEKIKEQLNAAQNSCNINANSYLEFESLNSEGELRLRNTNDFYVQVSILPYDNEQVDISSAYFTSIVIEPGAEMNKVKLDKNLDNIRVGVQPCLLYYDCYTKDSVGQYKKIGSCGLKIQVDVKDIGDL